MIIHTIQIDTEILNTQCLKYALGIIFVFSEEPQVTTIKSRWAGPVARGLCTEKMSNTMATTAIKKGNCTLDDIKEEVVKML